MSEAAGDARDFVARLDAGEFDSHLLVAPRAPLRLPGTPLSPSPHSGGEERDDPKAIRAAIHYQWRRDPPGTPSAVPGSKNGLGILSRKAIFPGTIVQLRIKDSVELGNVRYCSALDNGDFRIGLKLHGEG
jgi:hypothetical protein